MARIIALGLMMLITAVYAPDASAVQMTGGFAIDGAAEWVGTDGSIVTINVARALDFVTPADATANLTSPGVAGPFSITDSNGSFAGMTLLTGFIKDFTFKAPQVVCTGGVPCPTAYPLAPIVTWETVTGTTVTVDLVSLTSVLTFCPASTPGVPCDVVTPAANSLRIEGTVLFHQTGFDNTPGVFVLNVGTVSSVFSFAAQQGATPTAAPEPATMLLLGSGLVAAGVFARKRMQS